MKDNNNEFSVTFALIFIFLLWQFCILFGLWGGMPEGAFKKIRRLETRVYIIENQFNEILGDLSRK